MGAASNVFVGRLATTPIFDPIGDQVGRVRDAVVLLTAKTAPRVVGLVAEVPGRRRVFLPITRVTAIEAGQVITTGLVNLRRFEQRAAETLIVGELLDRQVTLRDGTGAATIEDIAIAQDRRGDWLVSQLFVRRAQPRARVGLRRRGEALLVGIDDVSSLTPQSDAQGAASLLRAYEGQRPADLADALQELGQARRLEVAAALDDESLADVLEELPEDDQVTILTGLATARAADVLEAMEPDDAADLLGELSPAQADHLLAAMEPGDAADVRRLLAYADDTAGGLMTSEPVIVSPEMTVAQTLAVIRRANLPPAIACQAFVTRSPLETPTGRFLGVVHFQRLLREPPHVAVGSILDPGSESVSDDATLSQIARHLAAYNLIALPVLDGGRRLIGAVTVDDVLDNLLPEDWRDRDANSGPGADVQEARDA